MRYILTLLCFLGSFQGSWSQARGSFEKDVEHYAHIIGLPAYALGVAEGDKLVFFKSAGYADSAGKVPITQDHIFEIASITKSLTSIALQQLEQAGKLSLNDPVDKFPNRYFTRERWNAQTTLAHLVSHTSESMPPGSSFVYNGSRYNIVFNAFTAINPMDSTEEMTRPFTIQIEKGILNPLQMTHTLTRFSEREYGSLRKWIAVKYSWDAATNQYVPRPVNPAGMQSGPGFGMMSSMRDLVRYSAAIGEGRILPADRYRKITTPFYPGSPQGMGWFTYPVAGVDLHWSYGYGDNCSALLLRVPQRNLSLILLSPANAHSAAALLGFGNPLMSPVVASFVRNYLLNASESIDFEGDPERIEASLGKRRAGDVADVWVHEAFGTVMSLSYSGKTIRGNAAKSIDLLKMLIRRYPVHSLWQAAAAFEFIAEADDKAVLDFGKKMVAVFARTGKVHPAKSFYAGLILEKNGETEEAMEFYNALAAGDDFKEQSYKLDAMMKVAKYQITRNPAIAKAMLERLVRYKEYVTMKDRLYNDAKEMLIKLQ
ncbi:CubicO group peptidase (beta-lactamase class C family) [Dyadobacter sp. BE34]|uniref:CubicO group peptidase (Beta-lactamase class C family) n=1 Tax=Dyadobacter fermentans TaxID=94254 RepID=A0ABU1QS10_9BACT|nr:MULTISPECIES: serine hydrolase domain-containing protein [Dyadobacter]MDR6803858.1 CubicO group peptidase (beta-lactamase class C family) [Dyadobacter fermentans]MDR7041598.1 CubicO group peptidase (beta-lactamase class C family) [Dyadobacter sp. BE242]MDR7196001.1 CubicO group peptidase (beta-lactamase class C family) [Dyadobacter sp. BE34]MDR7213454.1 CubicO group peptidase (beta-lactamase class C family) [Dyadobacter sp. BE31]MDR7261407.1 CubicO group peptidase (beta-lactamase class C fa